MEHSIRKRLDKAFFRVTGILGIAAIVGIVALFVMSQRYEHALQYYGFPQGDIGKAMTSFAEARSALRGAIGYDKEDEIAELVTYYEECKTEFNQHLEEIEKTMVTDEGHEAFAAIEASLEGYWELSDEILNLGSVTDEVASSTAQDRAFEELAPAYKEVYTALENLMEVNVTKGDDTHKLMSTLKIIIIIVMILFVACATFVSMRIGNNIADGIEKPLLALGHRIEAFSHGDLQTPFPESHTDDEISVIVDDCKEMAESITHVIYDADYLLGEMANGNFNVDSKVEDRYEGEFKSLLHAINKLNSQLDGTLKHINVAADQVTAGSGELATSAMDLADGATEQAGAIQELTATIENVANISEESAKSAEFAATRAKESARNANKSRDEMQGLIGAMERITETSKKIENIIATIEDIASQTNLLSLNASIEAARAGEAGRGFAVVADQIGKLAADSSESAVTTRELIIEAIEEIDNGNQIVATTINEIANVLISIEEFAEMASGAAQASTTQANMLKEIEGGIEQISTVVQSNSAASQETSAISEELSAHAINLKDMVASFQLRD